VAAQLADPARDVDPAVQLAQVVDDTAAREAENVPAAQSKHELEPMSEYVPAAQLWQLIEAAMKVNNPAAQYSQEVPPVVLLYFPGGQLRHALAPDGEY